MPSPAAVCQVDGGAGYDHKHQPALAEGGLPAMCGEIARTLLAQLAAEGCRVDASFRAALLGAFRRESEQALRRSEALALMNGLPFDAAAERAIVEAFAAQLDAPPGRRARRSPPGRGSCASTPAARTLFSPPRNAPAEPRATRILPFAAKIG